MRDLRVLHLRRARTHSSIAHRRRLFATVILLLALPLWVAVLPPVSAQEATPVALEESESLATASYVGREGREIGQIVINQLIDPFEDYDPNSPHDRTSHYVVISVTIKNTGVRPFRFDPRAVNLYDSDGFLYISERGIRSEAALSVEPDLQATDLAPGAEVRGAISYQVLNGIQLDGIFFFPDNERLIVLADLRSEESAAAAPRLGAPSAIIGTEGNAIGEVTVTRIVDPLDDYDPSRPPARAYHYLLVDLTVTNTSPRPINIDGSRFYLQDTDGFIYFPVNIRRRPEVAEAEPILPSQDLPADSQTSGVLIYEIPNEVTLARYFFNTRTDNHVSLLVEFETVDDMVPIDPAATPGTGGSDV